MLAGWGKGGQKGVKSTKVPNGQLRMALLSPAE